MTTTQIPPTTTNDTTPEEPAPGLYGPRGWTTRTPHAFSHDHLLPWVSSTCAAS